MYQDRGGMDSVSRAGINPPLSTPIFVKEKILFILLKCRTSNIYWRGGNGSKCIKTGVEWTQWAEPESIHPSPPHTLSLRKNFSLFIKFRLSQNYFRGGNGSKCTKTGVEWTKWAEPESIHPCPPQFLSKRKNFLFLLSVGLLTFIEEVETAQNVPRPGWNGLSEPSRSQSTPFHPILCL